MKNLICFLLFSLFVAVAVQAQVLWDFRGGVSYNNIYDYGDGDKKNAFHYFGELGIDVPIKERFALEIALRYKNVFHSDSFESADFDTFDNYDKNYWSDEKEDYEGRASLLELPIRFGYKFPLFKNTLLRLSAGPYVAAGLNEGFRYYQSGISTALTYEYKRINLGLNYNIPVHNAFEKEGHDGLFLTFGVKFKTSAWKSIGAGVVAVGAAAAVVGTVISSSDSESGSSDDDVTMEYDEENGASASSGASNRVSSDKVKQAKREANYRSSGAYKNADRAYIGYEDQLRDMKLNPERYSNLSSSQFRQKVKSIQSKMKSIREDMESHGVKRFKSDFESWNP